MVQLALRFWAIQAIFFKYPWTITRGGESIGMEPVRIPGYWSGFTLLPRLVNQELDRAFETRMDELENEILGRLQSAIFKRHRNEWCSIFLTCIILLHSLERDSWNTSAWEFETKSRASATWPLRREPGDYYRQNRHIADVLATHFKVVNRGRGPFTLDWVKPLNQQLLNDSRAAQQFIMSIQSDLRSPRSSTSFHTSEQDTRILTQPKRT